MCAAAGARTSCPGRRNGHPRPRRHAPALPAAASGPRLSKIEGAGRRQSTSTLVLFGAFPAPCAAITELDSSDLLPSRLRLREAFEGDAAVQHPAAGLLPRGTLPNSAGPALSGSPNPAPPALPETTPVAIRSLGEERQVDDTGGFGEGDNFCEIPGVLRPLWGRGHYLEQEREGRRGAGSRPQIPPCKLRPSWFCSSSNGFQFGRPGRRLQQRQPRRGLKASPRNLEPANGVQVRPRRASGRGSSRRGGPWSGLG